MKNSSPAKKRNVFSTPAIVMGILLCFGVLFGLFKIYRGWQQDLTATSASNGDTIDPLTSKPTPTINNSPASPQDNQQVNSRKEADPTPQSTPTYNTAVNGSVTLTSVRKNNGQLEARGIVSGITEGTCTAVVKQSSSNVSFSQSTPVRNTGAGYDCGILNFSLADLSSGEYEVIIHLVHEESTAESNKLTISI